jgi:hypothetical protein
MAFSESFVREAMQELERLERERQDIDSRIGALRQLIGSSQKRPTLFEGRLAEGTGKTFKAIVLGIIRENPGITTPLVTKVIKERGLEPGGATDVGHRVYNEIYRMRARNEVLEHEGGWKAA